MSVKLVVELSSRQELQKCVEWFKRRGAIEGVLCPSVGDPSTNTDKESLDCFYISHGHGWILAPDMEFGESILSFETQFYFHGYYIQYLWQELIRRNIFQVRTIGFSDSGACDTLDDFLSQSIFAPDLKLVESMKKMYNDDEDGNRKWDQEIALYSDAIRVYKEYADTFIRA